MKSTKIPGRGWAYLGLLLGLSVSVAGNVANTVLADAPLNAKIVHDGLRVPIAVLWPVWTWVGIEVLTRIEWRAHWSHWIARAILMGPTTLVAAVVSYLHLHNILHLAGEPGLAQAIGPLAIDGTLFGCTVALLVTRADARHSGPGRSLADRVASLRSSVLATVDAVRVPAVDPIGAVPAPSMSEVPLGPEAVPVADLTDRVLAPVLDAIGTLPISVSPAGPRVPAQRRPSGTRSGWDIAKAVQAILDGTLRDPEIADLVGIGPKAIQRTRRAVLAIRQDPTFAVPTEWKVPAAVVEVIRDELRKVI